MRAGLQRFVLVLLAASLATPTLRGGTDPCDGTFAGAMLGAELLDIGLTTSSLKLLNGTENPKLKRLLEFRLLSAIAAARREVEHGPEVDRVALPFSVPNWLNTVGEATAYVSVHHLESPGSPADAPEHMPLENLQVVKAWLERQPGSP
jgi:hypothetical protein